MHDVATAPQLMTRQSHAVGQCKGLKGKGFEKGPKTTLLFSLPSIYLVVWVSNPIVFYRVYSFSFYANLLFITFRCPQPSTLGLGVQQWRNP